jgi:hypothetical protein
LPLKATSDAWQSKASEYAEAALVDVLALLGVECEKHIQHQKQYKGDW